MSNSVISDGVAFNELDPSTVELLMRLERLVHSRTGSRIRDLRIEIREQEVILTGRAPTYYAKQLATHATLPEVAPRLLTNSIDVI